MRLALVHVVGAVVLGAVYAATLPRTEGGYAGSPLWLGMPHVRAVIALQLISLAGLLVWLVLMERHPPTTGFLDHQPTLIGLSVLLYAASCTWAPLAVRLVRRPSYVRAVLAILSLWGVAAAALALAVGTAQATSSSQGTPRAAFVALLPFVFLTVGVDALGWGTLSIVWVQSARDAGARG